MPGFSSRCVGFFGATSDVIDYALTLLEKQNLIVIDTVKDADSKVSRIVSVIQDNEKISELLVYGHQVNSHLSASCFVRYYFNLYYFDFCYFNFMMLLF